MTALVVIVEKEKFDYHARWVVVVQMVTIVFAEVVVGMKFEGEEEFAVGIAVLLDHVFWVVESGSLRWLEVVEGLEWLILQHIVAMTW